MLLKINISSLLFYYEKLSRQSNSQNKYNPLNMEQQYEPLSHELVCQCEPGSPFTSYKPVCDLGIVAAVLKWNS